MKTPPSTCRKHADVRWCSQSVARGGSSARETSILVDHIWNKCCETTPTSGAVKSVGQRTNSPVDPLYQVPSLLSRHPPWHVRVCAAAARQVEQPDHQLEQVFNECKQVLADLLVRVHQTGEPQGRGRRRLGLRRRRCRRRLRSLRNGTAVMSLVPERNYIWCRPNCRESLLIRCIRGCRPCATHRWAGDGLADRRAGLQSCVTIAIEWARPTRTTKRPSSAIQCCKRF